jgi:hypothetical protein
MRNFSSILRLKKGNRDIGGRMMSETSDLTRVVNAVPRLETGHQRNEEHIGGCFIHETNGHFQNIIPQCKICRAIERSEQWSRERLSRTLKPMPDTFHASSRDDEVATSRIPNYAHEGNRVRCGVLFRCNVCYIMITPMGCRSLRVWVERGAIVFPVSYMLYGYRVNGLLFSSWLPELLMWKTPVKIRVLQSKKVEKSHCAIVYVD